VNTSFHRAALGCALLFALGSATALVFIRPAAVRPRLDEAPKPQCRSHLGVAAPALEPGAHERDQRKTL
jgi:hypothetical protein